jgi:hypothetical protein
MANPNENPLRSNRKAHRRPGIRSDDISFGDGRRSSKAERGDVCLAYRRVRHRSQAA